MANIVSIQSLFEYDEGGRRGHSNKLFKKKARLDVRKLWNPVTNFRTSS